MKSLTVVIVVLFSALSVQAQKVKYKDLYVLLRAKNYKDGAVFLTRFLAANPEHPNANYQMGLMLEYKISELDLLKQSEGIISKADSAIIYLDKAYGLINEKDVKKHDDDYYELFKRRNLRTGKFEVILSDVQLDIENRRNDLTIKKGSVININDLFNSAISLYDSAQQRFTNLKLKYKDELTLGLAANDSTIENLKKMSADYDSSVFKFKEYKKLRKQFNGNSNDIIISINPLTSLSEEVLLKADFYSKKVDFINFSSWAQKQLSQIELQQIFIANLIALDESLELMKDEIFTDSVDLSSDIFDKITNSTLKELKSIDPESTVYKLLNYKIGLLNINSTLMTWYTVYADTTDVGLQLGAVNNIEEELKSLIQLQGLLNSTLNEQFWLRYGSFVKARYSTNEEFVNYLKSQLEIVSNQESVINKISAQVLIKDQWGYYKTDSVSLSGQSDSLAMYKTFYVDSLENRVLKIAGFFKSEQSNFYYIGMVPSSRQIDSLYMVESILGEDEVNSDSFIVEVVNALNGSSLYLMGMIGGEQNQLIHFSDNTGVLWSQSIDVQFDSHPSLSYENGVVLIVIGEKTIEVSLTKGEVIKK